MRFYENYVRREFSWFSRGGTWQSVGLLTSPFKDTTLTSRNDSRLCVEKRPHIMRVVLKGPGSDPLLVLLVHGRRHELKLDNRALRRPSDQAALVLWSHFLKLDQLSSYGHFMPFFPKCVCAVTTCVGILGEILTCETDRARTSHFVTKCVLINVPVNPSQIWTFPAESPLIIVWSDKKVTAQTTTSLLLDAPMALSTKSLCVVWPKGGIREEKGSEWHQWDKSKSPPEQRFQAFVSLG